MNNATRYFRDFYGCIASIRQRRNGKWLLIACTRNGVKLKNRDYTTYKGAKAALNRLSESSWKEYTYK